MATVVTGPDSELPHGCQAQRTLGIATRHAAPVPSAVVISCPAAPTHARVDS